MGFATDRARRRLPAPPAVPFDREKPGFRVATCPHCGSRCWILGPGDPGLPCAGCAPLGKWYSTIRTPRTRVMDRFRPARRGRPAGRRRIGPESQTEIGGTATADFGDPPKQEHPAVGQLREAYTQISLAMESLGEDIPKLYGTTLDAARSTIASVAGKIKEATA